MAYITEQWMLVEPVLVASFKIATGTLWQRVCGFVLARIFRNGFAEMFGLFYCHKSTPFRIYTLETKYVDNKILTSSRIEPRPYE